MRVRLCGHQHIYPVTDVMRQYYGAVQKVSHDTLAAADAAGAPAGSVWSVVEDLPGGTARVRTEHHPDAGYPEAALQQVVPAAEVKREVKRQLYRLFTRVCDVRFPWGSLTGIRPTQIAGECLAAFDGDGAAAARCLTERYDVAADKAELAVQTWLAESAVRSSVPPDAFCVYVGIPFCPTRCAYCSFTLPACATRQDLAPAYVEALLRQTAAVFSALSGQVHSLYIGGGTPTALPPALFARMLTGVVERLPLIAGAEITVEAGRPDTVTADNLRTMRACGVNRVCVNPQTIHEQTLRRIGRAHSTRQTADAVAAAQASGIGVLNMDLIAGLPGESPEMFAQSLRQVMAWHPANVTIHTLAMKRKSHLSQQRSQGGETELGIGSLRQPDAGVSAMLGHARARLEEGGWKPYYLYRQKDAVGGHENVGYAMRGTEGIYNVCMMGDAHQVIGLGSGAMSKRVRGRRVERIPMVRELAAYIERIDEMTARIVRGFTQPLVEKEH